MLLNNSDANNKDQSFDEDPHRDSANKLSIS